MLASTPQVTVLMSVYNCSRYVGQAIESILAQTYSDYEFVIIDDGSTDGTSEVIRSYGDPRIRLIKNEQNLGLTKSLNRGIRASQGEFIARQDADDFSQPNRLERLVTFLISHPPVAAVGSNAVWMNTDGEVIKEWRPICDPIEIQSTFLADICLLHATLMFRRACLQEVGGYNESMLVAQDCDLLFRLSEKWELSNVADMLYTVRQCADGITCTRGSEQKQYWRLGQEAAVHRRLKYGWGRLGLHRRELPDWVTSADRNWLARRYVWWSAAARQINRKLALQFLLIALALDPTSISARSYLKDILIRKLARPGQRNATSTDTVNT